MSNAFISSIDRFERHRCPLLDSEMAYIDIGTGDPIVFLHGNPTSSYLWRNVIPLVTETGRCLAPDLIGMGQSGRSGNGTYRFVDHARYLDAWFESLDLTSNVTLVGHDWGSALAFYWAYRFPERVRALVYMEALVGTTRWDEWPAASRRIFQAMRSPAGEEIVLTKNVFVERILPASVQRQLTAEEMANYRKPYLEAGEARRPTLTWPREIPIEGEPADVHDIIEAYSVWLAGSEIPKLFINAEPGSILTGTLRKLCRSWPNQKEVMVNGLHFIQEDSPHGIGAAISEFMTNLET